MNDSASSSPHRPVLVEEALAALAIRPDGHYVDATFGRGGHAAAILAKLGPTGSLLALDRDPNAAEWAKAKFADDGRFQFVWSRFSKLADSVAERGLSGRLNGVLLDLGVSSPQLDDPAAHWINRVDEAELERVLVEFGEERFHRRIVRAIIAARRQAPIGTTGRLAAIIASAVPTREAGKHPATRVFQAIRIAINEELYELSVVLPQTVQVLAPGGRLAVISFHSLEDRIVKQFMRKQARGRELPLDLPVAGGPQGVTLRPVGSLARPANLEIAHNPRARSALLRVAERV
ncbi:MAG: 16S rRNA (cytosine(1402)-N(4))-methyltransferase RsmH [Candidatus Competibacteraceae bacterium]|nr:16S rRNA (cytosine(1402)-N(4))-methyltransferase RsmH [Candidatus Competibacteraceae bacterium]